MIKRRVQGKALSFKDLVKEVRILQNKNIENCSAITNLRTALANLSILIEEKIKKLESQQIDLDKKQVLYSMNLG